MKKIRIIELPPHDSFEVMRHTFRNLDEVRAAVSIEASPATVWSRNEVSIVEPKIAITGIYVAMIYESYPCFDSSDSIYEDRRYCNFFFSDKPFTIYDVERLRELPFNFNFCYVNKDMPSWATPAIYWGGDSKHKILIATTE